MFLFVSIIFPCLPARRAQIFLLGERERERLCVMPGSFIESLLTRRCEGNLSSSTRDRFVTVNPFSILPDYYSLFLYFIASI